MQRNGRVGVKSRKAPKDVCASSALMSDNRIYARIAWRERSTAMRRLVMVSLIALAVVLLLASDAR